MHTQPPRTPSEAADTAVPRCDTLLLPTPFPDVPSIAQLGTHTPLPLLHDNLALHYTLAEPPHGEPTLTSPWPEPLLDLSIQLTHLSTMTTPPLHSTALQRLLLLLL